MVKYRAAILLFAVAASAQAMAQDTAPSFGPAHGAWGIDLSDQDRSVRPGDDFAMYQNGGWFKRTELSPTKPISAYWRDVRMAGTTRVDDMMANLDAENRAKLNRTEAMVAAFHHSADQKLVDSKGLAPLQPALQAIRAVCSKAPRS